MFEADVARVEEGGEALVVRGTEVEGDVFVEATHGDDVKFLAGEADVLEVGGAEDLGGPSQRELEVLDRGWNSLPDR